jgi:molybdopterin-dependent oxidoreductase-like protein protein
MTWSSSALVFSLGLGFCSGQASQRPLETPRSVPELLGGASVAVQVEGKPEITITEDDLAKMPRNSATVSEHGKRSEYEGVLLHDILQRAGAPLGDQLRGKALSTYILATARDGYAVVYTLPEVDPAFSDGDLLVADKSKGQPLAAQQGPFRIIAPHDKKLARSLRMLQRIDVVQLKK